MLALHCKRRWDLMVNEQTCRVHFLIVINHSSSYKLSSLQFIKFASNSDAAFLTDIGKRHSSAEWVFDV